MDKFPLVDFGIIVALDEEFKGLKQAMGSLLVADRGEVRTFYRKVIPSRADKGKYYHAIITNLNVMGQPEAGNTTRDLVEAWRPQNIVLVGIAGGMHKDVDLGDVVISTEILNYEPRKETEEGTKYRPDSYPANQMLLGRMTEFILNDKALNSWRRTCKKKNGSEPKVHKGVVASGNAVIADEHMREVLRRLNDQILAVEMEAANAFAVSFNFADPRRIIMVRGVCDHANPDKAALDDGGKWRPTACFNPARFVQEFIRFGNVDRLCCDEFHLNVTSRPKLDPTFPNITGNSYPFFERLLQPIGPLIDVELGVRAFDSDNRPLVIARSMWTEVKAESRFTVSKENFQRELTLRIIKARPDYFSLHLEIEGEPERIQFDARTLTGITKGCWIAR